MSSPRFEAFLARLYADDSFLRRFLTSPAEAMSEAALDEREQSAATRIDRVGLVMAARSYRAKRQHSRQARPSLWRQIKRILRLRSYRTGRDTQLAAATPEALDEYGRVQKLVVLADSCSAFRRVTCTDVRGHPHAHPGTEPGIRVVREGG